MHNLEIVFNTTLRSLNVRLKILVFTSAVDFCMIQHFLLQNGGECMKPGISRFLPLFCKKFSKSFEFAIFYERGLPSPLNIIFNTCLSNIVFVNELCMDLIKLSKDLRWNQNKFDTPFFPLLIHTFTVMQLLLNSFNTTYHIRDSILTNFFSLFPTFAVKLECL